jgi:glutamate-1-semialdehyde 2,1-aminomutase
MTPSPGPSQSKTFCILPWIHLAVLPEGSTQLCCVASSCIEDSGAVMSVEAHPLEAIWNSVYMRGVRRDMVAGKHVAACSHCYVKEKNGGVSRRQEANARWADALGPLFDALVEESRHRDFEASELPLYYQLMPGNLCNLKCRMCAPHFSSQIERDPVHSQWIPSLIDDKPVNRVDWTKGCARVGPEDVLGVGSDGFSRLETHEPQPFRWTNGNASLTVWLPPGVQASRLRVRLRGHHPKRHGLRLLLNETVLHDAILPTQDWDKTFTLPHQVNCSKLTVKLQSSTFRVPNDPRDLGVAVELVELVHTVAAAGQQQQPASRLPSGPWYRDDAWIRDVLLQNADCLRGLYFTGGEPMIERQVENVLQYLVEKQAAQHIVLELNSNCTVLRESMLQKLQQFREVRLGLSIDAFGAYYEYIRYPARWAAIRRNVEKLVSLSSERFKLFGGVVLQVYNALNATEILEFFDGLNIPYAVHFATWPSFLNVAVLPASVKAIAADRLRAYADRGPPQRREHLLGVVQQIESGKNRCTPEGLRDLMLFTNDLDATRQQDVRAVHGELLDLLHKEGFVWTAERSALVAA